MGRNPCCSKEAGLNRGAWTAIEDKILTDHINLHGEGKWKHLPNRAGLNRCGKSCRLRWLNYLRPDIKRGNITQDEEDLIIRLHKLLGNRWSLIARRLPGRTDNEVKNYWNTIIGKRLNPHSLFNISPPDPSAAPVLPILSSAIRTKASRCTTGRLFQLSAPHIPASPAPPLPPPLAAEEEAKTPAPELPPPLTSAELDYNYDPFTMVVDDDLMNFVMDDDFLSDFFSDVQNDHVPAAAPVTPPSDPIPYGVGDYLINFSSDNNELFGSDHLNPDMLW